MTTPKISREQAAAWVLDGMAIALIVLGAALRVLRHFGYLPLPPNVAPVGAMALFGGAYLGRRRGWLIPVSLMLASDAVIGFDRWPVEVSIYICFLFSGYLGWRWQQRRGVWRLLGATLAGSVVFFLVTNAAVWAFADWYPHTLIGLQQCFAAALPFFRNTMVGDVGYTIVFFGLYQVFMVYWRRMLRPERNHIHA